MWMLGDSVTNFPIRQIQMLPTISTLHTPLRFFTLFLIQLNSKYIYMKFTTMNSLQSWPHFSKSSINNEGAGSPGLQDYHFTLHHIPRKSNSKADILSRRPGFEKGVNHNDNIILFYFIIKLAFLLFSPTDTLSLRQISSYELTHISFLPWILRSCNGMDKNITRALEKGRGLEDFGRWIVHVWRLSLWPCQQETSR
jgi:hypothetical protein